MTLDLWTTLIPLAIATAVLPLQVAITIVMLRSPRGTITAAAWILGMTLVRLIQYAIFGVILDMAMDDGQSQPGPVEGVLLLVVGVLLLVSAARKILHQPDEDAPPRWIAAVDNAGPRRAFAFGVGLVALSPKLWAFTLGAIGAITDAQLDRTSGWVVFVVWILLAESLHLLALLAAVVAPVRAGEALARTGVLLERYNRPLLIAIGLIFGVWFLYKAVVAFNY